MTDQPVNGVNGTLHVKVTYVRGPGTMKFVFCSDKGDYIGDATFCVQNDEYLKVMASQLPDLVLQVTSGLALPGQLPPGMNLRGN